VADEFLIGGGGAVLGRTISNCESRMADEFSRNVSLQIMRHAMSLDLQWFEDPAFYITRHVRELGGFLRRPGQRPVSGNETDQAIARHVRTKFGRRR
jgi:hypothetical protein